MSTLRQRSPVKDQELGPTPNKTVGKTPQSAAVSPAQVQPAAEATGIRGFVGRNKKLLVAAAVVASVVIIGVSVSSSRSNAAAASAASRSSSQDGVGGTYGGGNGGKTGNGGNSGDSPAPAPGIYSDPDATTDPDAPTAAPTKAPTAAPTVYIPPLATTVCYVPNNLGNAKWFNAVFLNSFWSNGSAVEGRLAVKGDCWVNRFSVGAFLYGGDSYPCPNPDITQYNGANYAMVVGGSLFMNGTTVANGGISYGSLSFVDKFNVEDNCPKTPNVNAINLGSMESDLRAASSAIASMTSAFSMYTISANRQTLTFKLNGSIMTESFLVAEQDLLDADVITITGTPKMNNLGEYATIIFNVVKSASNTANSFDKTGFAFHSFSDVIAKQSVWNFNEYQKISIRYGNWYGSILAPDANFENTIGNLYGGVYASSWNSDEVTMDMKFHWYPFQGRVFTTCA